MKQVKLIIGVDGTCSIDALGFADATCKTATEEITRALGGNIQQQRDKPEARIRERQGRADREQAR